MKFTFENIIGKFLNQDNQISPSNKDHNHKELEELEINQLKPILKHFKNPRFFEKFKEENKLLTIKAIREDVNEDNLIIQAIANLNELDKTSNLLVKRLREWFSLYLPEVENKIHSNEKFVEIVLENNREKLIEDFKITNTMGKNLEEPHYNQIILLAKQVETIYELRLKHEEYLHTIMKTYCPNFLELAGTTIAAKLLELARNLKHLAMLPASTVQLLGAEKALFRHIKTGSKSPKHGIIFQHPLIQKTKKRNRGKAARSLADKLSICARIDFFKGEFRADKYKRELNKKFLGEEDNE
jgi:nucleolar protein 56